MNNSGVARLAVVLVLIVLAIVGAGVAVNKYFNGNIETHNTRQDGDIKDLKNADEVKSMHLVKHDTQIAAIIDTNNRQDTVDARLGQDIGALKAKDAEHDNQHKATNERVDAQNATIAGQQKELEALNKKLEAAETRAAEANAARASEIQALQEAQKKMHADIERLKAFFPPVPQ